MVDMEVAGLVAGLVAEADPELDKGAEPRVSVGRTVIDGAELVAEPDADAEP